MDEESSGKWASHPLVIALLVALGLLFGGLALLSIPVLGASLPLIAVGGIVILILLLTLVSLIFSSRGLANKDFALGLPEGSIRAVISLSLIVLFPMLSVFLFKSISQGDTNTIARVSDEYRMHFFKDNPSLTDIASKISRDEDGKMVVALDSKGAPIINPNGTPQYLYDVSYSASKNAASQDFAKQLLVLMGTLMTAITSFYLGANTATSAKNVGQAEQTVATRPTVSGVVPESISISAEHLPPLKLSGANLNTVVNARITKDNQTIPAQKVESSPTSITCIFDPAELKKAMAGDWNILLDDGASGPITVQKKLNLTP